MFPVSANHTAKPTQTRELMAMQFIRAIMGLIRASPQHREGRYCLTSLSPAN